MAKNWLNKLLGTTVETDTSVESFYQVSAEEVSEEGTTKMLLIEPRAFSEAQDILTHLKKRVTVVVNLGRVTSEQAKRIIDYLTGATSALEGSIEKIGHGIFLCTPNNVDIEGRISEETTAKKEKNTEVEW
ncbi:MAG: cell division protein SepF [Bacilli bacterium]|nr:cell division protein SepF [Bacilli bacterium]